jgi:hypothetical protein
MATPVHPEPVPSAPPNQITRLQWHGKWLLYSDSDEGTPTVIDTTGAHHAIELSGLVHRLLGTRGGFSAYWSGQPSAGA